MRTETTDVLVVGAGPAGAVAAAYLAKHDIKAITLSRHRGPAHQPRGSFTNQRTVEVFRDLGIEAQIDQVGTPLRDIGHNVLVTSMAGTEIMRYECYGTGARLADYATASPCINYNLPQHILEPVLVDAVLDQGAEIRFRHELIDIHQDDASVTATVRERDNGETYQIKAKYAIAADGGNSRVAEQMGFAFEGEAGLIHMANAWIEADLTPFVEFRPAGQYIVIRPGGDSWVGSGTFITVKPWTEWLFTREYDPAKGEPDMSDDGLVNAVRELVGDRGLDVKVKGSGLWQVNNLIATRYRNGRVFIAGDAAHRHSPSGGLGTNTSIQDSHNLVWKLALVLKGQASPDILESYHEERRPIGKQVVDRAMFNLKNKVRVTEVLGLHRGQTTEEGWAALDAIFADVPGAEDRRAALADIIRLQNNRSTAHGIELGQQISSRMIVDDETPFPQDSRDPAIYYQPTTHPGARLPHVWLEKDRSRVSTLDLVGHGRFSLIVGVSGAPWIDAAKDAAAELEIELPVFQVGLRCEYDDVLGDWLRTREITDSGALLVRPDGYVAWRSVATPDAVGEALLTVLRRVLGRSDIDSADFPIAVNKKPIAIS